MRGVAMLGLTIVLAFSAFQVASTEATNPADRPIAESAGQTTPITVGDTVPPVTVQDANGNDVALGDLLAKQKTALIFYRGGWCPFCNKHLSEVASLQREIAAAGYQVIGINADRPEEVLKSAEQRNYPFTIFSDSDLKAALAFGVAFKLDDDTAAKYKGYGIKLMDSAGEPRYSLPVPAFYLIDTAGKVTFEHHDPDYTKRISKEDLLKAIQAN
jgi:peroxiredoxin